MRNKIIAGIITIAALAAPAAAMAASAGASSPVAAAPQSFYHELPAGHVVR